MTNGSVAKEFHKLLKTVGKLSDGQAAVTEWDDEDVGSFKVQIQPNGGVYEKGKFTFRIKLGDDFPDRPPSLIACETPIYHPNIDPTEELEETNVCLNIFNSDEWQDTFGLEDVIQGLLFLFYEPNLEDPLSPYFDSTSEEDFEHNVLESLKGGEVEGVQYSWNYGDEKPEDAGTNQNKDTNEIEENGDSRGDGVNCVNKIREDVGNCDEPPKVEFETQDGPMLSTECNTEAEVGEELAEKPQTPQPRSETLGILLKPKELSTTVLINSTHDKQPDIVLDHAEETELSSAPDFLADLCLPAPGKMATTCSGVANQTVSMSSFDAVMPEMNIFFVMLNNITKNVALET